MSLLSVDEARERILSKLRPVTTETLPLVECASRVLAQDVAAANDLPLFDNSSMDGFAVRAADVVNAAAASPRSLRVVADIPAGSYPTISVAQGETARIMTGAQLPEGADAVVPVEDTDFDNRDAEHPRQTRCRYSSLQNPAITHVRVAWTFVQEKLCCTRVELLNRKT